MTDDGKTYHDVDHALRVREAERKVIDAAVAYEKWQGKWYDYTKASGDKPAKQQVALMESVRALTAARQGDV